MGRFELDGAPTSSIWDRLKGRAIADLTDNFVTQRHIEVPWPYALELLREFGTRQSQQNLNFRFALVDEAKSKVGDFAEEIRRARKAREAEPEAFNREEINSRLQITGFRKRELKDFQLRDLDRLLSLPHGANFSVPGAGKTTVAFALHLLIRQPGDHLFVVGPKAAFPAWRGIVEECMDHDSPDGNAEPFTLLDASGPELMSRLRSGATRFLISYDLMIRNQWSLTQYFARQPTHLLLDEAHRMKAGIETQRGAFLLRIAHLPKRRDILTGTPMPQGPSDLGSQLAFLWPGHGLDLQIDRGIAPRQVLGNLYVRTTKHELGLPPVERHFLQVDMLPGQLALYGVVRSEVLRQLASTISTGNDVDYVRARRSVMRLLQLSSNPMLALKGMAADMVGLQSGIVDEVLTEGASAKMRAVADHARRLATEGRKSVIWTIFTDTIHELVRMLADLNPVAIHGSVPSGEFTDPDTREGRLRRFHADEACRVLIANPAAAGEGISLHTVCHDAIYLDRSYVSTHYLQSIDRIHRLGLAKDVATHIYIYQTKAPVGLGSIDLSVSRRLAKKLRNLQQLLDDQDLHQIALDEESADDPVDYDLAVEDIVDLIQELEGRRKAVDEEEEI